MPRFFRSARAASVMRSASAATSALGSSSCALASSASITAPLLRASTRNLRDLALEVGLDVGAQRVHRASLMPSDLAKASSAVGRCWRLDLLHRSP
jgi:hypothetical protein